MSKMASLTANRTSSGGIFRHITRFINLDDSTFIANLEFDLKESTNETDQQTI